MSDIAAFLLSCADTDEREAREATAGPWTAVDADSINPGWNLLDSEGEDLAAGEAGWAGAFERGADAIFIARHDPARVLADCAALRAVVAEHAMRDGYDEYGRRVTGCQTCILAAVTGEDIVTEGPCNTLRILAQPFKGRPGWDETWGMP